MVGSQLWPNGQNNAVQVVEWLNKQQKEINDKNTKTANQVKIPFFS